jgi:hypothetical protein
VFPARIVETVDVFEESNLDLATGLPVATPDEFGLQRLEEAFDGGIEAPMFVKRAVRALSACTGR